MTTLKWTNPLPSGAAVQSAVGVAMSTTPACGRAVTYMSTGRAGVEFVRPGVGGGRERGEEAGEMAQKVFDEKEKRKEGIFVISQ